MIIVGGSFERAEFNLLQDETKGEKYWSGPAIGNNAVELGDRQTGKLTVNTIYFPKGTVLTIRFIY